MKSNKINLSNGVTFILALLLSFVFTLLPWEEIRGVGFEDYRNYVERIYELGLYGESYLNPSGTILGALTSELLWGYFLLVIAQLGLDPDIFLWSLSFFMVFTVSLFLLKHIHPLLVLLFLFNPLLVDFFMSQHRNALAFTLLLWAIIVGPRHTLMFLVIAIISVFIHTSSILIFPVYYLGWLLAKKYKGVNFKLYTSFLAFSFAITVVAGKALVLTYFGDRRADIDGDAVSLLYSFFWFLLLPMLLFFYHGNKTAFFSFVVFNLVIFILFTIVGDYSSRFLVIQYPFLLIALAGIKGSAGFMLFSFLFIYQSVQWVYWFRVFIG